MLTKRHMNVLNHLNASGDFVPAWRIPNGHGHCDSISYASEKTLRELEDLQLISYGSGKRKFYGYAITSTGRAALQEKEAGE